MKRLSEVISWCGLALVIGPPITYLVDSIEKDQMQVLMLIGTALWFASVPLWMGRSAEPTKPQSNSHE